MLCYVSNFSYTFWPTVAIFRQKIGTKEYIFDTKRHHGCA